jgi:CDP-glucose 4,6-dehydratase
MLRSSEHVLDRYVRTGGTGLLGRWLIKRLVEVGARVICLVRKRPSKAEFANAVLPAQTQEVEGDIRD